MVKIINSTNFKKYFSEPYDDKVKTAPKGILMTKGWGRRMFTSRRRKLSYARLGVLVLAGEVRRAFRI